MDENKNAVAIFNKMATSYQNKYMDVSMYANSFDFFCNVVKNNAQVLELACGPGNITQHLLQKRPDLHFLSTDLAPNMLELARKNNPTATFQLLDSREINSLAQQFDAIVCGFCLPYLSMEESTRLLNDSYNKLTPNGILYLSTIEGDYSTSEYKTGSGGDQIFMHFYSSDFLTTALEKCGFNILTLQKVVSTGPNNAEVTDLVIVAKK